MLNISLLVIGLTTRRPNEHHNHFVRALGQSVRAAMKHDIINFSKNFQWDISIGFIG